MSEPYDSHDIRHAQIELLKDYLQARSTVIVERSPSIVRDYKALMEDGKGRATKLGMTWCDLFMPLHVREAIEWAEAAND